MTAAPAPSSAARTVADLARALPGWVKGNVVAVVTNVVIASVVGYVLNAWLMAVRYEGSLAPDGAPVTSKGNLVSGSLFWMLTSTVITAAVAYRRSVGKERFWREVRTLPTVVATLFRRDGVDARVHALWGAAIALVAGIVLSPSIGAVMGIGLVASAPSLLGRVLAGLVSSVWSAVTGPFMPGKQARPLGLLGSMVGIVGGAVALVAAFVVSSDALKIVAALGCAAAAWVLGQQRKAPGVAALLVLGLAAAAVVAQAVLASPVLADDGGFAECGSSLSAWLENCAGAGEVRRLAGGGAVAAGIGGVLGGFIGSILGNPTLFGGGGLPWWQAEAPAGGPPAGPPGGDRGVAEEAGDHDEEAPIGEGEPEEAATSGSSADGPPEGAELAPTGPPSGEDQAASGEEGDQELDEEDEGLEEEEEEEEEGAEAEEEVEPAGRAPGEESSNWPVADGVDPPDVPAGWVNVDGVWMPPEAVVDDVGEGAEPAWQPGDVLRDPTTGEELPVADGSDPDVPPGWVSIDGIWMPPEEAAVLLGMPGVDRYRNAPPTKVDGQRPDRLDVDEGHTVQRGETPLGPDGEPLRDPRTGMILPVDQDGNVKYGQEWLSPEAAAGRMELDGDWQRSRQDGQRLVDRFKDLQERLANADPAERAGIEAELRRAAVEINESYPAKTILKSEGRTGTTAAVDVLVQEIYRGSDDPAVRQRLAELGINPGERPSVDAETARRLADMGIRRGGREFTADDFVDIRNASSSGTVGIDRDVALNEMEIRKLREELAGLAPGTYEAQQKAQQLLEAERAGRMSIDPAKYRDHLSAQLGGAPSDEVRAAIQQQLDAFDKDAARMKQTYLGDLDRAIAGAEPGSARHAELVAERAAAQGRLAGMPEVGLSPSRWNDMAQRAYGDSYGRATGTSADKAYQAMTQQFNPEAYRDLNVLANDPRNTPFNRADAAQTASVSPFKTFHNDHLADQGLLTRGEAIQENARGYAKDINSKTLPLLQSDPNVDPAKVGRLQAISEVLDKVGKGLIPPGQVDGHLAAATGVKDMTLGRAMAIADANLEAGIKMREAPPPSKVGEVFGRATDLATMNQYAQEHMRAGMGGVEATGLAAAQTAAGNAAIATGIADPRLSMAAGSLLPGGMSNLLPDQMVENTVGTGYQAGRALVSDVAESFRTGELSSEHVDKFLDSVANRPGADPFKGYVEGARLLTEAPAGHADVTAGDLAAAADASSRAFEAEVARGAHGVVLQGYSQLFEAAAEASVDPLAAAADFVKDSVNIVTSGAVVDGELWGEMASNTKDVIERAPLIGNVVQGYNAVAEGIGESGVGGFAQEMYEGGAALGGEAVQAVADAGSSAVRYIESFWK